MAIFHVDYINGNNGNDGSAGSPYATVKYALETNSLGAGDTVKVAGSALTTRDTAATYDRNIGYKVLTTSTDLTAFISVNDIVQINPPSANTEFQDWFTSSVTGITATTITINDEIDLPGTAAVGNWTIKTIDSTILSNASGTFETWASGAGIDVVIEGGYDSGFTSVIGLTYFRRNLPSSQVNGICYNASGYASNSLNTVTFKNFQWSQFNQVLSLPFGVGIYGTNLRLYTTSAAATLTGTYGQVASPDSNPPELYFINSSGGVTSSFSYSNAFINNGNNINMNVTVYGGTRLATISHMVNNLTIWNPGQNSLGSGFGYTYGINTGLNISFITNTTIIGNVTFNVIDVNRSGFYKNLTLFKPASTINFKPTSINVINGGLTNAWWEFVSYTSGFNANVCNFMLPTGFNLKNQLTASSRESLPGNIQAVQIVDDEYTWIGNNSAYIAADTTDFSTGDSSKVVLFGSTEAYGSTPPNPNIFQFTKTGIKPTSITMRYKFVANGGSISNVFMILNNYGQYELNSQPLTATDWTDITYPFSLSDPKWDLIPVGMPIQMGLRPNSTAGNPIIKVDSITVNYA